MITPMKTVMIFLSRGLISFLFLFSGFGKLMVWRETVDAVVGVLSNWYTMLEGSILNPEMYQLLIENASPILAIATSLEILGGVFLLLGFKPRLGALFLILFLLPVTILFHAFWFEIGPDRDKEMIAFIKNFALIGALMFISLVRYPNRVKE